MIEKLCYVMGIQYMSDPDDSYVLTVDNMKKMLAIQMRFRYECVLLLLLYLYVCNKYLFINSYHKYINNLKIMNLKRE